MLSCEEVCRKVASDEYAEAGWWERQTIRFHLFWCGDCRSYEQQLRAIGSRVRELLGKKDPELPDFERLENDILKARSDSPRTSPRSPRPRG